MWRRMVQGWLGNRITGMPRYCHLQEIIDIPRGACVGQIYTEVERLHNQHRMQNIKQQKTEKQIKENKWGKTLKSQTPPARLGDRGRQWRETSGEPDTTNHTVKQWESRTPPHFPSESCQVWGRYMGCSKWTLVGAEASDFHGHHWYSKTRSTHPAVYETFVWRHAYNQYGIQTEVKVFVEMCLQEGLLFNSVQIISLHSSLLWWIHRWLQFKHGFLKMGDPQNPGFQSKKMVMTWMIWGPIT